MSRILFEERVPLATFYQRRASRILPVFLLYIGAAYVFSHLMQLRWTTDEIVSSLFFLRTYFTDIEIWDTQAPVGHFWSLNAEEHSYMFLALVAAVPLLRKREGWFLMVVAALSACATLWYWKHPGTRPTDDYMLRTECAVLGLMLSAGYRQLRHHVDRFVRPWMPLVALLSGAACYLWAAPDWLKPFVAPFLLAFAVNHIGDSYRFVVRALEWRPLCMLGVWSYSLYLWQQPFYEFHDVFPPSLALASAFAVGLASFYFFEAPVRAWLNRTWATRAAPAEGLVVRS